ncbi:hypothetical protein ONS95_010031 [Cadophora gregata]|uniref:uncharacterized protein n=1 Tax=Cadophora gregata TaxID=51156 RepID=UPI0026DAB44E|nr:uncharacterized protein ONS95_010031 [Cadophora gregata]KAK0121745.1 hypothetical protein ONS95_010031 [Cadophora gregata]
MAHTHSHSRSRSYSNSHTTTHTRQLYPETLRRIHLVLRTIGLGLAIALLVVAIILTTRTGDTPPITYVAVIWSLLLNLFDWTCLLLRGRIPPGALMSLDLIAVGLLVGGVINLAVVNYRGDGDVDVGGKDGNLVVAERWLQGILMYVFLYSLVVTLKPQVLGCYSFSPDSKSRFELWRAVILSWDVDEERY